MREMSVGKLHTFPGLGLDEFRTRRGVPDFSQTSGLHIMGGCNREINFGTHNRRNLNCNIHHTDSFWFKTSARMKALPR